VHYLCRGTTLTVLCYPHVIVQNLPSLSIGIPAFNEARNNGNALAGQAFWVGMAVEDIGRDKLLIKDTRYPFVITA
jgi:hypothetical protein